MNDIIVRIGGCMVLDAKHIINPQIAASGFEPRVIELLWNFPLEFILQPTARRATRLSGAI